MQPSMGSALQGFDQHAGCDLHSLQNNPRQLRQRPRATTSAP